MAYSVLHGSAAAYCGRGTIQSPQHRSLHNCSIQTATCASLHRQYGSIPALARVQKFGRKPQRVSAHTVTASFPSWLNRTHVTSPNTAAASVAAARAAAVLSTPLWQHAAQSACIVIASWAVATTVSRWLVTNADKLEAGEVALRLLSLSKQSSQTPQALTLLTALWYCRS